MRKRCPKCNGFVLPVGGGWKCVACGLNSESSGFYHAQFGEWIPLRSQVVGKTPVGSVGVTKYERKRETR